MSGSATACSATSSRLPTKKSGDLLSPGPVSRTLKLLEAAARRDAMSPDGTRDVGSMQSLRSEEATSMGSEEPSNDAGGATPQVHDGICAELGAMLPGALITEKALAALLGGTAKGEATTWKL